MRLKQQHLEIIHEVQLRKTTSHKALCNKKKNLIFNRKCSIWEFLGWN